MTILVSGSDALNKYEFICMIDVHVHESFENTIWLWLKILDTYHIFVVLIISSILLLFSFSQPISCFALLGRLNIEQMRKRISLSFTTCFRIQHVQLWKYYLVGWKILNTHQILFILIIVPSLLYNTELNKLRCSRDPP